MQTTKERLLLFRQRLRQILSGAGISSNPNIDDGWILDKIQSLATEDYVIGTVFYINKGGLAYVKSCDERIFSFTFNKICGYKNEQPRELKQFSPKGLTVGIKLRFRLDSNCRIKRVMPLVHK